MDSLLQNKVVVRQLIQSISEIESNKMYVKSYLQNARSNNGKKIYPILISKAKEGSLFTIPGKAKNGVKCHMWLGSDIIKVINGHEELLVTEKSYAKKVSESMNSIQRVDLVLDNLKKSKEIERLKKELKSTSFAFQEQVSLREEYQSYIATERSSHEIMKQKVLEYLFSSTESVHWFQFPFVEVCGIYCLISNHEIVYVGQSVNIPTRISAHHSNGKIFDSVRFFKCEKSELDEKEMFLIKLLKPKLNGQYKNSDHPLIKEFKPH